MRLAFLTNNVFPPREGIARHVFEVAQRLQQRGHEVTVLARGRSFARWRVSSVAGLRVRHYPHYPLQPFHHALARAEFARWLRDGADGADLLHVHLPLLPPLPTDLPIVATFHSPMLADTGAIAETGLRPALIKANARLFSRRYEQWYLDHARTVVTVSGAVRTELEACLQPGRAAADRGAQRCRRRLLRLRARSRAAGRASSMSAGSATARACSACSTPSPGCPPTSAAS